MDRPQNNGSVKAVSPRYCSATSVLRNCCFNCRAGQSHKDNVRCTAVEEQPEVKEVQLSQPGSTSLLLISPGTLEISASQSHRCHSMVQADDLATPMPRVSVIIICPHTCHFMATLATVLHTRLPCYTHTTSVYNIQYLTLATVWHMPLTVPHPRHECL